MGTIPTSISGMQTENLLAHQYKKAKLVSVMKFSLTGVFAISLRHKVCWGGNTLSGEKSGCYDSSILSQKIMTTVPLLRKSVSVAENNWKNYLLTFSPASSVYVLYLTYHQSPWNIPASDDMRKVNEAYSVYGQLLIPLDCCKRAPLLYLGCLFRGMF